MANERTAVLLPTWKLAPPWKICSPTLPVEEETKPVGKRSDRSPVVVWTSVSWSGGMLVASTGVPVAVGVADGSTVVLPSPPPAFPPPAPPPPPPTAATAVGLALAVGVDAVG